MGMRDDFERAYAEDNQLYVDAVYALRSGDTYLEAKVSRAWYWWKRSRATLLVQLPRQHGGHAIAGSARMFADEVIAAIESHGLRVTP